MKKLTFFDYVIYILVIIIVSIMVIPFYSIIMTSFADMKQIMTEGVILIAKEPSLSAYQAVFRHPYLMTAFETTIIITILGTILDILFTAMGGYALSKKGLPYRNVLTTYVIITMVFNGGIIPTYLTVKAAGLLNSIWAVILPVMTRGFYLFLARNFFRTIPDSLEESAKIDGASDIRVFAQIIMPLSKPILATISLYYAVRYWNTYFSSLIYNSNPRGYTLQVVLKQLFTQPTEGFDDVASLPASEALKAAAVVVVTIPILAVYPYLQKYFVKGMMVGSLKG